MRSGAGLDGDVCRAHTEDVVERQISRSGVEYLTTVLRRRKTVQTAATLWKIPHKTRESEVCLKVGRYELAGGRRPLTDKPKSELTLDDEEFVALLGFLSDNLEPFRIGPRKWLPLDDRTEPAQIEQLKALFADPNKGRLVEFITTNDILPEGLLRSLEHQKRSNAVDELETMLALDLTEAPWQQWFERNDWVLGTEFVRILEERPIDVEHIADYLMQAYDGFLDLVEIKRPEGVLRFWADKRDHGNYVPHSDLVKAITQAARYLYEVEREANSVKFLDRVGIRAVKPRCVLIFGRSNDWDEEQREAYRILNASYHNLSILTFDHVLDRARRMLGLS